MTYDKKILGRALWKELHERAYYHNGTNDDEFIKNFSKKIPRYMKGCSCNEFWKKWIKKNPPNYKKGEYFRWTVRCHNAVNIKLGKPTLSVEQAIIHLKNNSN